MWSCKHHHLNFHRFDDVLFHYWNYEDCEIERFNW